MRGSILWTRSCGSSRQEEKCWPILRDKYNLAKLWSQLRLLHSLQARGSCNCPVGRIGALFQTWGVWSIGSSMTVCSFQVSLSQVSESHSFSIRILPLVSDKSAFFVALLLSFLNPGLGLNRVFPAVTDNAVLFKCCHGELVAFTLCYALVIGWPKLVIFFLQSINCT